MAKYIITGVVHPERADINFGAGWVSKDGTAKGSIRCEASQLCVILDDPSIDGYLTALVRADGYAQAVASTLGFSLGSSYSVELIQVIEESGACHVFGVREEQLMFDPWEPIFQRAIAQGGKDVFFAAAMRDYVGAITNVPDCPSACYRAIEAIKSAFDPSEGPEGWEKMHAALGTDKEAIKKGVQEYAAPVRHGNWAAGRSTNAATRLAMLKLTRDILMRYLDHVSPVTAAVPAAPAAQKGWPDTVISSKPKEGTV